MKLTADRLEELTERDSIKRYAYNDAWASMFTALVNRFPDLMTGDMLHSIAADTIDIRNGIKPPEELIADLKERTGFDMSMPPHSDEGHRYIEIEEGSGDTIIDKWIELRCDLSEIIRKLSETYRKLSET